MPTVYYCVGVCKYCQSPFFNESLLELHDYVCDKKLENIEPLAKMRKWTSENMLSDEQIAEREKEKKGFTDREVREKSFIESSLAIYELQKKERSKPDSGKVKNTVKETTIEVLPGQVTFDSL